MIRPKQGDIIKLNLGPTKGHEQSGYRPVLVVSNASFSKASNMIIICPITSTDRNSPLHIRLDGFITTGFVMCDQVKAVDVRARNYIAVEAIDDSTLWEVTDIIYGFVEFED